MAKAKQVEQSNVSVKEYVDRIGRLEDEKETLTTDIKEIYEEAHANGVDKKALRQAIRAKRKEVDVEYKQKVNGYLEELGELPLFALVK